MRERRCYLYIILTAVVFCLLVFSCSEGLFNFNDQTGNLSFSFRIDNAGGDEVSKVVFTFSNSSSGDSIRRELLLDGNSVECYISRVDTGNWEVSSTIYLADGSLAVERKDSFELLLAQTAIADLNYWSDGTSRQLDLVWERSGAATTVPMISLDSTDALITAYHTMGAPIEDTVTHTSLICQGSGFDEYLSGIRLTFPDYSYFEYQGGWSRAISDVGVEVSPGFLMIDMKDYSSRGLYSLSLTDLNDQEVTGSDDCSFNFEPVSGFATVSNYTGLISLLSGDFEKNDSTQAGSYIFYLVNASNGTVINEVAAISNSPVVYTDTSAVVDLNLPAGTTTPPATEVGYLVLATIDASLSQAEIDAAFIPGTTNLLPNNFTNWLFTQFGDRINFVGISVAEYTF